jgi:prolyl-tRNA synthetase
VVAARRTGGKAPIAMADLVEGVRAALEEIQAGLLAAARERREQNSIRGVTRERMIEFFKGPGGFAYGGFCGGGQCEDQIKAELGATVRVLPDAEFRSPEVPRACVWCGSPSVTEAVWAQAY